MASRRSLSKGCQAQVSELESLLRVEGRANSPRYNVLGVQVDAVQIPEVISRIEAWIASCSASRFIAVVNAYSIVEAHHDGSFRRILSHADLAVPDGMPLVWFGRKRGYAMQRRVYGPELTESFCRATRAEYRHFFYGGAPGVAENLASVLHARYGVSIAGTYSPPFRALTSEEDTDIVKLINEAAPDVLWVGLGTPKQERWMYEHRNSLRVPVLVGIGAAFDFLTGRVRQAPPWMRERGLEWLFRLGQEPKRLWRRYLICGPEFVWAAFLEFMGLKTFPKE